jgi:predicted nucleotidyltransferase
VTDFASLLLALTDGEVEFIVIGGMAAVAHGSAHVTVDLDVVYARTPENLVRLAAALRPLSPYLRGAPAGLPFDFDPPTIRAGLNFTLVTSAGDVDLLGEVAGGGTFASLLPRSVEREVFGLRVRFVDLPTLIHLKRAAGRPKDLERIAELEALLEESKR